MPINQPHKQTTYLNINFYGQVVQAVLVKCTSYGVATPTIRCHIPTQSNFYGQITGSHIMCITCLMNHRTKFFTLGTNLIPEDINILEINQTNLVTASYIVTENGL